MPLPAPLTPPGADCRGLPSMPLDVNRLRGSQLTAQSNGDEFKAAVLLWSAAWMEIPAASLPNDDDELAHLAGISLATWFQIRQGALRGWVLCADGRLYHPVIAEKVSEVLGTGQAAQAYAAYNESAQRLGWPRAQKLTPERRRHIRSRLKDCGGLGQWSEILNRIERSPYLMGQTSHHFAITLDFILQPTSFQKIIEGFYDERRTVSRPDYGLEQHQDRLASLQRGAMAALERRRGWEGLR